MVVIQLSNSCNDVRFVLPKVGGEKKQLRVSEIMSQVVKRQHPHEFALFVNDTAFTDDGLIRSQSDMN